MRANIVLFKYLYYIICCGSLKKIYNYVLNAVEKKLKRIRLKSLPVNISIEPCNICNLRCPGCVTGVRHVDSIEPCMLTFEQFRKIFDQVKESVMNVSLYNWGEPFLNKNIFLMVKYATSNKCGVTIHSNLNIFDESMAEKAVASRLTHIYLSIDGATQETYEIYRKGGNLSRVFRNIEILTMKKKEMKSIFPILTWKYLIFPHNVHEIKAAGQKAKQLGANAFEIFPANLDNVSTFGEAKRYDINTGNIVTSVPDSCNALWDSLIIYPGGSALPCCQAFRKKDVFGNVFDNPIKEVWNNDNFLSARKVISTKKIGKDIRYPCRECKIIQNFVKVDRSIGSPNGI